MTTAVKTKRFTQRILISMSWIRAVALLMQVSYMVWFINPIPVAAWVFIAAQGCLLLAGWLNQKLRMGDMALLLNLCLDLLFLAGYVYFTGGVSNPLISLLLLAVVTASVALRQWLAFGVLTLAVVLYSLLFLYQPESAHGSNFSSHLAGMWLVFIASASLLFYVASYLSRAIRQQEKRIKRHEQRQLRDDYITALGLSAADAAHQMNTPLATLAVMIDDALQNDELKQQELQLMQQQIECCQSIAQSRQQQFDELKSGKFQVVDVKQIIQQLISGFRLLQPEAQVELKQQPPAGKVKSHIGLHSALLNLADNAAKASQQAGRKSLELNVFTDKQYCTIEIIDHGPGMTRDIIEAYGWRPREDTTTKSSERMGVGTLISNASIEYVDGQLAVKSNDNGVAVSVRLPLVTV
ncbi:sensor histidine kinase [Kangiella shandongensis]|uniref:sensor histidine kinase n=1 Tax=Kangiella shandongensis TaxID=2763258 RepID=UPI001CBEA8D0|nr:HAMP domain-containing sensor histidine kinase [Kangiella shandongensis]